nr:VWA domain-containing protein [Acidobacteriota bacterium]
VDVRVFDAAGRFIANLAREDFEILEDGVPQPLVAISLVGRDTSPAGAPPTQPPAPTQPTQPPSSTWIFFFDINHLTPGSGFERAREALGAFVRDRFREGDLAGVIDGKGMVNGRLTTVRAELVSSIASVKASGDARSRSIQMTREWPRLLNGDEAVRIVDNRREAIEAVVRRACADDPGQCPANADPEPFVREKAQRVVTDMRRAALDTLKTVNALASGLARMTGPKTVVFLSEGFVTAGMETTLGAVVGQIGNAGARVYAIDVRGLNRGRGAGIIDEAAVADAAGAQMGFDTQEDGVNSLAIDTGGMMIRNENNIGRALDTVAADASRYYVLGYQPANIKFDGKYRSIEVRVKREGARVRARKGYLAISPSQMLVPSPMNRNEPEPAPVPVVDPPAPPPPTPAAPVSPPELLAASVEAASATAVVGLRPDAAARVRELSDADAGSGAGSETTAAGRAWSAYQRGDLEAALPLFTEAAASAGVRPWALYALGLTHAGLGRPRDAIAAWERLRLVAPAYQSVYTDLAATHASLGDLTGALTILRLAAARWPSDPDIHNGIGVIQVRRGALDDAIASFTKATAAAPDHAVTHLNLGRAYELRYARELRYVSSQRRWVAPEEDRKSAAESYERCVALGGPYAKQAAEALSRLQWSK